MNPSLHSANTHQATRAGWLLRWWPAIVWAIVISVFSTKFFAASNTAGIIIPILHWLFPRVSLVALADWHELIRKCGHFVEYFILSVLILRGLRAGRRESHLAWTLLAILLVAGYASMDEFHQRFVPGRTPAVRDVLIDTTGGIVAQIAAALAFVGEDARAARARRE